MHWANLRSCQNLHPVTFKVASYSVDLRGELPGDSHDFQWLTRHVNTWSTQLYLWYAHGKSHKIVGYINTHHRERLAVSLISRKRMYVWVSTPILHIYWPAVIDEVQSWIKCNFKYERFSLAFSLVRKTIIWQSFT